ncbi:MAG: ArsR/SmtB family transcription factor [Candidatus Krumholzibacteriia bacterium]
MPPAMDPAGLFHSLSDPVRLRLLRLLGREELNVQELVRITGLAQPRVSRHLAVLREQGWLTQRREGTFSWYRLAGPAAFPHGKPLRTALLEAAEQVAGAARDDGLLAEALNARRRRTDDFFSGLAERWDTIRREYEHPDVALGAVAALVAPGLRILDIGTGTGAMLPVFGAAARLVVALDHSRAMLARAAAVCRDEGLQTVALCNGVLEALPFGDGTFDACHCGMVLHHVEDPTAAVAQMARVVRPGGRVLLTAFAAHDEQWMRDELAHRWLGFTRAQVEGFCTAAGLAPGRWLVRSRQPGPAGEARPPAGGRAPCWPDVFLATANKPGP